MYAWQAPDKLLHSTYFSICLITPLPFYIEKNSPIHVWEVPVLNSGRSGAPG
jgi:hypothetical protein